MDSEPALFQGQSYYYYMNILKLLEIVNQEAPTLYASICSVCKRSHARIHPINQKIESVGGISHPSLSQMSIKLFLTSKYCIQEMYCNDIVSPGNLKKSLSN